MAADKDLSFRDCGTITCHAQGAIRFHAIYNPRFLHNTNRDFGIIIKFKNQTFCLAVGVQDFEPLQAKAGLWSSAAICGKK